MAATTHILSLEMAVRNEDGKPETVMYQFLAPMLLNEVQKQNREMRE